MRTNKKGILLKHPAQYKTRSEILENVPQEYSGCKGCKYWTACYGGCPSGTINDDWRNRTYLCPVWKSLFEFHEKILSYCNLPLAIYQQSKGSIEIKSGPRHHDDHADVRHGDIPHGDSHEDHCDTKNA